MVHPYKLEQGGDIQHPKSSLHAAVRIEGLCIVRDRADHEPEGEVRQGQPFSHSDVAVAPLQVNHEEVSGHAFEEVVVFCQVLRDVSRLRLRKTDGSDTAGGVLGRNRGELKYCAGVYFERGVVPEVVSGWRVGINRHRRLLDSVRNSFVHHSGNLIVGFVTISLQPEFRQLFPWK